MILPVFLPHVGCGSRCIYCNQNHITKKGTGRDIGEELASLFASIRGRAEVALYGGNPLGMEAAALERLFGLFDPYVDRILFFRISARPDPVSDDVISLLKKHNVRKIELGMPTFNEEILRTLRRGHTAAGAMNAYRRLRKEGFEVGMQVMVGLPGETFRDVEQTTSRILALAPSFIRVYPLVVIDDTPLALLFREGRFLPGSLEQAVAKSAFIYVCAWKNGIKTIKMGLTENDVLREKIVSGPYHPAFGYLVKSEAFGLSVEEGCRRANLSGEVLLRINRSDLPHLIGLQRRNMERLKHLGIIVRWATDTAVVPGHFAIVGGPEDVCISLAEALPALQRIIAAS